MKVKVPPIKTVHQGERKISVYGAFENEIDLCSLVRLNIDDRSIGAIALNKGKIEEENQFQIIFGFKLKGIHNFLFPEEITGIVRGLSEAMKNLIPGEKITFIQGCYDLDESRQAVLGELVKSSPLPLPRVLIQNEQSRIKELTQKGLRADWQQYIFCSWSADKSGDKNTDWLSKLIKWSSKTTNFLFDASLGKLKQRQEDFLIKLFNRAYTEGFLRWSMLLNNQAGLEISPMTEKDLWQWMWSRFNSGNSPSIPQLLILSQEKGKAPTISEKITNKFHSASVLIQGKDGYIACPEHRQSTDRVFVKNRVCGVMVMNKPVKAWSSRKKQLAWMWEILSQKHIKNVEAIVEISPANKFLVEDSLYRHAKQTKAQKKRALTKGSGRDAGAEVRADSAFEAQKKLYKGERPLNCGVVFLVYADSQSDLSMSCRLLTNSMGTAQITRERDIASKIWLETLPITFKNLLADSSILSDRRVILDSDTVAGVLPLTIPQEIDSKGVEFLTHQGGKPVCIDLFTKTSHALVTGTTGSGKSVLLWRFMLDALSRNIPVVGMDFPAADGESSFKTAIELLGDKGAYFDISRSSSNIMEPPDLRRFNAEEREMRMKSWLNFIREALLTIIMGRIDQPYITQRVDSILRRALSKFLHDQDIVDRYNLAFEHGWRSPQWQEMPVLKDFLRFCSVVRLQIKNPEESDRQALSQIHAQINALLASPLGNALGKPSSFSPEPMVKFFAHTGLSNEQDAYIMAINSNAACVRVALSSPKSLFVGDELSVLCRREGFSTMLGTLCATARKDGLSVLLSAQDPDTICNSKASAMIMQNITYRITGRITSNACESYQQYLKYPAEIINPNASDLFLPQRADLSSSWLLEKQGKFWQTNFYPGNMVLASVANNQEERRVRKRVLARYAPTTKGQILGLADFSSQYIPALKDNSDFDRIK